MQRVIHRGFHHKTPPQIEIARRVVRIHPQHHPMEKAFPCQRVRPLHRPAAAAASLLSWQQLQLADRQRIAFGQQSQQPHHLAACQHHQVFELKPARLEALRVPINPTCPVIDRHVGAAERLAERGVFPDGGAEREVQTVKPPSTALHCFQADHGALSRSWMSPASLGTADCWSLGRTDGVSTDAVSVVVETVRKVRWAS